MRAFLIVWAAVVGQISVWTFAPGNPPSQTPALQSKQAPATPPNDGAGYGSSEPFLVEARISQRDGALRALGKPWSSFCTEAGHKEFVSGVGEYYYQRQNQTERYPENFGKPGADYIARQWATADDQRIDRLTREAYTNGYLKPDDFKGLARKIVATVVAGERVIGKGCAG